MAKKNQLVEAKNPPEKKKKESQTSAPEQIQIFEELERKKKVKLSIVSYAIGVCAVLLLVLFIARWAGSDAWFTVMGNVNAVAVAALADCSPGRRCPCPH